MTSDFCKTVRRVLDLYLLFCEKISPGCVFSSTLNQACFFKRLSMSSIACNCYVQPFSNTCTMDIFSKCTETNSSVVIGRGLTWTTRSPSHKHANPTSTSGLLGPLRAYLSQAVEPYILATFYLPYKTQH